jgi:hypothetical protein
MKNGTDVSAREDLQDLLDTAEEALVDVPETSREVLRRLVDAADRVERRTAEVEYRAARASQLATLGRALVETTARASIVPGPDRDRVQRARRELEELLDEISRERARAREADQAKR